jgi:hypothetical protein
LSAGDRVRQLRLRRRVRRTCFKRPTMAESAPAPKRLLALLEERGWQGWTRLERVPGRTASDGPRGAD